MHAADDEVLMVDLLVATPCSRGGAARDGRSALRRGGGEKRSN